MLAAFSLQALFPYDLDRYLHHYEQELDRVIRQARAAPDYQQFTLLLEVRMEVLRVEWEQDRDLLERRDGPGDEVQLAFLRWEGEADRRIAAARAGYLVSPRSLDRRGLDEAAGRAAENLREQFKAAYRSLAERVGLGTGDGYNAREYARYREELVAVYRQGVEDLSRLVDREYDLVRASLAEEHEPLGLSAELIDEAAGREEERYLREREALLSRTLNRYANRAASLLFRDTGSLRREMERQRAEQAAADLLAEVEAELAGQVDRRLHALLAQEIPGAEELSLVADSLQGLYQQGLDAWARAAADLVRRQAEWHEVYEQVYVHGTGAWSSVLDTLKNEKEKWDAAFSEKVEAALQHWDAALSAAYGSRGDYLRYLEGYQGSRRQEYDAYIRRIQETLGYGEENLQQIEALKNSIQVMIREKLGPFTGRELSPDQARALVQAMAGNEGSSFFAPHGLSMQELFDLKIITLFDQVVLEEKVTAGPRLYLVGSRETSQGFDLTIRADATVLRHSTYQTGWFIFKKTHHVWKEQSSLAYYTISYTYRDGVWNRSGARMVSEHKAGDAGAALPLDNTSVLARAEAVSSYADIIDSLDQDRRDLLQSVGRVREAVVEHLEQGLLERPVLSGEEDAVSRYLENGRELLLNELDLELLRASSEQEFWARQAAVVEQVLDYALDRSGREDAETTRAAYIQAREDYHAAIQECRLLLEDVGLAETRIDELAGRVEAAKRTLAVKEEQLGRTLDAIAGLRIASADLDLLRLSLAEQVCRSIEEKHAFLEEVCSFGWMEEDECLESLLKEVFLSSGDLYERLHAALFDPAIPSSLPALERTAGDVRRLLSLLGAGGDVAQQELENLIEQVRAALELVPALGAPAGVSGAPGSPSGPDSSPEGSVVDPDLSAAAARLSTALDQAAAGDALTGGELLLRMHEDLYLVGASLDRYIEEQKSAYAELFIGDPTARVRELERESVAAFVSDLRSFLGEEPVMLQTLERTVTGQLVPYLLERYDTDYQGEEPSAFLQEMLREFVREHREEIDFSSTGFGGAADLTGTGPDAGGALPESDLDEAAWLERLEQALTDGLMLDRLLEQGEAAVTRTCGLDPPAGPESPGPETAAFPVLLDAFTVMLLDSFRNRSTRGASVLAVLEEVDAGAHISVESLLRELRAGDPAGFINVASLLDEVAGLPGHQLARLFGQSAGLELRYGFLHGWLGSGNGSTAGPTSDIVIRFMDAFQEAVAVAGDISRLQPVRDILGALESGVFDLQPGEQVRPLNGNLDHAVLALLAEMQTFEENGMLSGRLDALLATMADYVAAAVYLDNLEDFRVIDLDAAAISSPGDPGAGDPGLALDAAGASVFLSLVRERVSAYFQQLVTGAGELGFGEQDQLRIDAALQRFLLGSVSGEPGPSLDGMSADELTTLLTGAENALRDMTYHDLDGRFDLQGYAARLLEPETYRLLQELDVRLGVGLENSQDLQSMLDYSARLEECLDRPTEKGLAELFSSAYVRSLFDAEPEKAEGLVTALCLRYLLQHRLPAEGGFDRVYAYAAGGFAESVLHGLTDRERVVADLLGELRLYETELRRSGRDDYAFSAGSDRVARALDTLDEILDSARADLSLFLDFDAYLRTLDQQDLGLNGSGIHLDSEDPDRDAPGLPATDPFPGLEDFLKRRYAARGAWAYVQAYRIAGDTRLVFPEYAGSVRGLSLLPEGLVAHLENTMGRETDQGHEYSGYEYPGCEGPGYEQAYYSWVSADPLAESLDALSSGLVAARDAAASALRQSFFKQRITDRLAELASGAYQDYRGAIHEHYGSLGIPDPKTLLEREMVKHAELSAACSYLLLDDPDPRAARETLYMEVPGTCTYTHPGGEGETGIAPTYVTGNRAVNSYIEFQNRFAQSLLALSGLARIEQERADRYLEEHCTVEIHEDGEEAPPLLFRINVLSGTDPAFTTVDTIQERGLEEYFGDIHSYLAAESARLQVRDSRGTAIVSRRFSQDELLYLIASVRHLQDEDPGDLQRDIDAAGAEADRLREDISSSEQALEALEEQLGEARDAYNRAVDRLNEQRRAADERYHQYLQAEEVSFYASNIYLARDTAERAIDLYRAQLLEYTAKQEEAEQRFMLLRDIKLQGTLAAGGDEDEWAAETGNTGQEAIPDGDDPDELALLHNRLLEMDREMNQWNEALQLLQIFQHAADTRSVAAGRVLHTATPSMQEGIADALLESGDEKHRALTDGLLGAARESLFTGGSVYDAGTKYRTQLDGLKNLRTLEKDMRGLRTDSVKDALSRALFRRRYRDLPKSWIFRREQTNSGSLGGGQTHWIYYLDSGSREGIDRLYDFLYEQSYAPGGGWEQAEQSFLGMINQYARELSVSQLTAVWFGDHRGNWRIAGAATLDGIMDCMRRYLDARGSNLIDPGQLVSRQRDMLQARCRENIALTLGLDGYVGLDQDAGAMVNEVFSSLDERFDSRGRISTFTSAVDRVLESTQLFFKTSGIPLMKLVVEAEAELTQLDGLVREKGGLLVFDFAPGRGEFQGEDPDGGSLPNGSFPELAVGTTARELLGEELRTAGGVGEEQVQVYLDLLERFFREHGQELFLATGSAGSGGDESGTDLPPAGHAPKAGQYAGILAAAMRQTAGLLAGERRALLEQAAETYAHRSQELNGRMDLYTHYRSMLTRHRAEQELAGRELAHLLAGLQQEQVDAYHAYVDRYRGTWHELDQKDVPEELHRALDLAARLEHVHELILVYEILTGTMKYEDLAEDDRARWGEDLALLRCAYGIDRQEYVSRADLVAEGALLDTCDFSERGILRKELLRGRALLERVGDLHAFTRVTGGELYGTMLERLREAHTLAGADRTLIEEYRAGLQISALVEERNRFQGKTALGRAQGLDAWDDQYLHAQEAYRLWLEHMSELLRRGKEQWRAMEEAYVMRREQWVTAVKEGMTSGRLEELGELEKQIQELAAAAHTSASGLARTRDTLSRDYVQEVVQPQWITEHQVLAMQLFSPLKKNRMTGETVREAVAGVQERIESFAKDQERYEARRLYHQLEQARELILAEIRGTDDLQRMTLDALMEQAGFARKGSGYQRSVLVDYSLLGGKQRRTVLVGRYSAYTIDPNQFALDGVQRLVSMEDNTERKLFMLREVERLRRAKEKVLGTEIRVGSLFKRHVGRFPTGDEVARYVEENREKKGGLFGGFFRNLLGSILKKIGSLFGGGGGGGSPQEDFSAFQRRLQGSISYRQNTRLETGRIMLECQRWSVVEAQARDKADAGFFGAPLVPGGPSLKSIGSVALAVTGVGAVGSLAWNTGTTLATMAEGKMDGAAGVLSILQDTAVTGITGGFSGGTGVSEALFNKKLSRLGGVTDPVKGAGRLALIDAQKHLVDQALISGVRAFQVDENGRFGWSAGSFTAGLGDAGLGSIGAYAGSYVTSRINIARGAEYVAGGYGWTGAGGLAAHRNAAMTKLGATAGGLTAMAVNNATGVEHGYTFNLVNSRLFGARNEVGMLSVNLGGAEEVTWDVSTAGLDISLSGIAQMVEGQREIDRYRLSLESKQMYETWVHKNMEGYALEGLTGREYRENKTELGTLITELGEYLEGGGGIDTVYGAGGNRRVGDTLYIEGSIQDMFDLAGGRAVWNDRWSLSRTALVAGAVAHEWRHDGRAGKPGKERAEEIRAHRFDAMVWKGLKQDLGVRDPDEDLKLIAYELSVLSGSEEFFESYILETHDIGNEAMGSRVTVVDKYLAVRSQYTEIKNIDFNAMRQEGLFKRIAANRLEKKRDQLLARMMESREHYIALLPEVRYERYGVNELNADLLAYFDQTLHMTEQELDELIRQQGSAAVHTWGENERIEDAYAGVFQNIVEILAEDRRRLVTFELLNNEIASVFDTSALGFGETSPAWFMELYEDERGVKRSFFETYLELDEQGQVKLREVADVLQGKIITVDDTDYPFGGAQNTHFISDVDVLHTVITDMDAFTRDAGIAWSGFTWREGYRSGVENLALENVVESAHMYNRAIDVEKIMQINSADPIEVRQMYEICKRAKESQHYNFLEFKMTGFHFGYAPGTRDPTLMWGGTKRDSYDSAEYILSKISGQKLNENLVKKYARRTGSPYYDEEGKAYYYHEIIFDELEQLVEIYDFVQLLYAYMDVP
jgi:hypothetical protein